MRIVIIEDDRVTGILFSELINSIFYEIPGTFITVIPNRTSAEKIIRESNPDVIVSDLGFDDCTIAEMIEYLKTLKTPVVILTGHSHTEIGEVPYPVVSKDAARKHRGLLPWVILKTFLKSRVQSSQQFSREAAISDEKIQSIIARLRSEIPPDEPLPTGTSDS